MSVVSTAAHGLRSEHGDHSVLQLARTAGFSPGGNLNRPRGEAGRLAMLGSKPASCSERHAPAETHMCTWEYICGAPIPRHTSEF